MSGKIGFRPQPGNEYMTEMSYIAAETYRPIVRSLQRAIALPFVFPVDRARIRPIE